MHLAPWTAPHHVALRAALARLGYVEGQNLWLDPAGHGLRREGFAVHAEALVRQGVDVIHTSGDAGIEAARAATARIPILGLADDLVRGGFAAGYAQPGGNVTGISILAFELDGKRQELLLELVPETRRLAAIGDAQQLFRHRIAAMEQAARQRGVTLDLRMVRSPEEIGPTVTAMREAGAEALNVLASPLLFNNRAILFERVAALRLPAIYQWPSMAREGGLLAYGPNIVRLYAERIAPMLARLLGGASPATLPIELPTHFELVVNRRVAEGLGIAVPLGLITRADEVIE